MDAATQVEGIRGFPAIANSSHLITNCKVLSFICLYDRVLGIDGWILELEWERKEKGDIGSVARDIEIKSVQSQKMDDK